MNKTTLAVRKHKLFSDHRYAIHRHYESEFGDLAPQMISNALNIQLIILSEAAGSFTIMKVSPYYNPDALPLFLHKNGKHYNGISPKLSKSYWLSCQTPPNDKNDKQAEHKARAPYVARPSVAMLLRRYILTWYLFLNILTQITYWFLIVCRFDFSNHSSPRPGDTSMRQ